MVYSDHRTGRNKFIENLKIAEVLTLMLDKKNCFRGSESISGSHCISIDQSL